MNDLDFFKPILIGNGRLATHLAHRLSQVGIPHAIWAQPRALTEGPLPLEEWNHAIKDCTHFWILTKDEAIPQVAQFLKTRQVSPKIIHSSASTVLQDSFTLHPLMTFGPKLYSNDSYEQIPWISFKKDHETDSTPSWVGRLTRHHRTVPDRLRVHYHIACVMASNLPMILWSASTRVLKQETLSKADFRMILNQTLENYLIHGEAALTGPLARGDHRVLGLHLNALDGTPEEAIYRQFISYFSQIRGENSC